MPGNWWQDTSPAFNAPGGATYGGGGAGTAEAVQYRSPLDARRSAAGDYAPIEEYPDGYLGSIIDRRQDKLLSKVQERLTERSYQRGVHVGSKIGRDQYFWDSEVNPEMGLERQAQSVWDGYTYNGPRYAPQGNPVELLAHQGKTAGMAAPQQQQLYRQYGVDPAANPVVIQDPTRKARLQKMLPTLAV